MTSPSSSPFSFLTSSMSFQTTATLSQLELICHHFHQHGCSTRACLSPWVPSLAVFLLGYLRPVPGCFSSRPPVPCSSAHLLDDCFSDPIPPSPAAIGFMSRISGTRCRLLLLYFSFEPILGFDALVGFFSPDCDFLVVLIPVASLSRCFVRDLSSGLLLQLHLVVVYSDVAAGGHSSTAV